MRERESDEEDLTKTLLELVVSLKMVGVATDHVISCDSHVISLQCHVIFL